VADVQRSGQLRIITVWRDKQLIGVLPLYIQSIPNAPFSVRRLGFISTGEAEFEEICPDYLNILCLPGEEAGCAENMWQAIGLMDWDYLEFLDSPQNAILLRTDLCPTNVQYFSRGRCPVADLTGGFETYLGRLSSNSRQQARRLLREGEQAGAKLEIISMDQVTTALDDLVRLPQAR
jgi:hypothetical protein